MVGTTDPIASRRALDQRQPGKPHTLPEILDLADALVNSARCSECAFYDLPGICRKGHPQLIVENGKHVGAWPPVLPSGWCGEFKAA